MGVSLLREFLLTSSFTVVASACAYAIWKFLGFGRFVLSTWCLVEVIFFALQRLRYHRLNRVNEKRPSAEDVDKRFHDFLTLSPVLDIREFISGWFLHIPFETIHAGNVADFVAYAYWAAMGLFCRRPPEALDGVGVRPANRYQPREELSDAEQERLAGYVRLMEDAWGVQFPPGYNDGLKLMGHLWEPLKVVHKPLFVHLASEGSMLFTHLVLQMIGFERCEVAGFTYWVRGLPLLPSAAAPEARVSALRSVWQDLAGLVLGEREASPRGPFDFLASLSLPQVEALQEYQARLREAVASVTPHLPPVPGLGSVPEAMRKALPSMPSLDGMLDSLHGTAGGAGAGAGVQSFARRTVAQLPSLSDLSEMPGFRDLKDLPEFSDLSLALPPVRLSDYAHGFRDLHDLSGSFDDIALPTMVDVSKSAAAAREALTAALPVLNLPDWQLPAFMPSLRPAVPAPPAPAQPQSALDTEHHTRPAAHDTPPTWRLGMDDATASVVRAAELDTLFASLSQPLPEGAEFGAPNPASTERSGEANAADGAAAAPQPRSLAMAWVEAAGSSVSRRFGFAGLLSGFSLRSLCSVPALTRRDADVPDANAAAALRRAVEGSVLERAETLVAAAAASAASTGVPSLPGSLPAVALSERSSSVQSVAGSDAAAFAARGAASAGGAASSAARRYDLRSTAERRARHASGSPAPARSRDALVAGERRAAEPSGTQRHMAREHSVPAAGAEYRGAPPVVFMHGVGFGVFPYLGFVWKLLRAFSGRPFILLEVRHVSLRLCMRARGVDDVVRALALVLSRHGVTAAHFVGHSFGTFVIAQMRKLYPDSVASVLLCDPVCLLTCFPKLLYNFIYRGVTLGDVMENPAEAARWLAARDLIIAATFCRHFWWHTLMLWPWELPDPSVIVLSGKDTLVPHHVVLQQLNTAPLPHVRVLEHPALHHGHFLFRPAWQDQIVQTYKAAVLQAEAVVIQPRDCTDDTG